MSSLEWFTTNNGVKMPGIIYGTAWKKEKTSDYVYLALKSGFRGIDTACQPKHYNEKLVGEAIFKAVKDGIIKREEIFIQTKFTPVNGQDPNNIPYDKNASLGDQIAQSFEVSLKNLRTGFLDSLVLHSPIGTHEMNMQAWRAMEKICKNKGTKQLGISNCYNLNTLKNIFSESEIKPSVVQNRFYNDTDYDNDLRKWCDEQNIIYQSFWTLTANPHILKSSIIRQLAHKYDRTEAQIFFRYLNQNNIAPLTGTTNQKHMKEDLEIFGFALSDTDIADINKLF